MQDFSSEYNDKIKCSEILNFKSSFKIPSAEDFVNAYLYLNLSDSKLHRDTLKNFFKIENKITIENIKTFISYYWEYVNNFADFPDEVKNVFESFEFDISEAIEKNWLKINQKELADFLYKFGIDINTPNKMESCYIKRRIKEIKKYYNNQKFFTKNSWAICMSVYFILLYPLKMLLSDVNIIEIYATCFIFVCTVHYFIYEHFKQL